MRITLGIFKSQRNGKEETNGCDEFIKFVFGESRGVLLTNGTRISVMIFCQFVGTEFG